MHSGQGAARLPELVECGPWKARLDAGVKLIESKIEAGRLEGRVEEVQRLGRLLSTRHRDVQLAGRGRLVLPEGFREFLGVEPGGEAMVVGAAVCVEIWHPEKWSHYVGDEMPAFRQLLDSFRLSVEAKRRALVLATSPKSPGTFTNHSDRSHAQLGPLTRDNPAVVTRRGNASHVRKALPAGDAGESSNWAWRFLLLALRQQLDESNSVFALSAGLGAAVSST